MSYIKAGIISVVVLVGAFVGWRYYAYYSSDTPPVVEVLGVESGGGLSGEARLVIKAYDAYKVGSLKVDLDGKSFVAVAPFVRSFSYPFTLITKDLEQGHHALTIEVVSAAQKAKKTFMEVPFYVDNLPLQAALTKNESDARVYQGRTLHVEFQTNKEIKQAVLKTLSESYPCYLQSNRGYIYECFVPIDCEEVAQEYPYSIDVADWVGEAVTLEGKFRVVTFPFKKQTIRIDKEKIQQENEIGRPEKELADDIQVLTKKSPKKKLWHGRFIVPIELKNNDQITSDFGVIRATQERGLMQHKALDLVAYPKSVVWAPQDGIIVLKDRYAHSGNTIGIDHGHVIISLFFHLDSFADIDVGDPIKKGKPVGTVGKTGYATGYHLHWEQRVNTVPVDPLEWTKPNF